MKYQGGKERISKRLVEQLEAQRLPGQPYLEPFVGGASVISKMSGERVGADVQSDLIALWVAARDGWSPRERRLSRAAYNRIKANPHLVSAPMRALLAYGCSFAGKLWGGAMRPTAITRITLSRLCAAQR